MAEQTGGDAAVLDRDDVGTREDIGGTRRQITEIAIGVATM